MMIAFLWFCVGNVFQIAVREGGTAWTWFVGLTALAIYVNVYAAGYRLTKGR